MITGAHSIIYSTNPDADRAFLRDVLALPHVDVGGGWLIFGLPPAEVAVHPSDENDVHELYLMCDDIEAFVAEMKRRHIECGPVQNLGWGLLTDSPCRVAESSVSISRVTRGRRGWRLVRPLSGGDVLGRPARRARTDWQQAIQWTTGRREEGATGRNSRTEKATVAVEKSDAGMQIVVDLRRNSVGGTLGYVGAGQTDLGPSTWRSRNTLRARHPRARR